MARRPPAFSTPWPTHYDDLEPWYRAPLRARSTGSSAPSFRPAPASTAAGARRRVRDRLPDGASSPRSATRRMASTRPAGAWRRRGARVPAARLARAMLGLALPGRRFRRGRLLREHADFVDDPGRALRELARVCAPGRLLFLEVEHRFSLDLGWALLSSLTATGSRTASGRPAWAPWRARPARAVARLPRLPAAPALHRSRAPEMLDRAGLRAEPRLGHPRADQSPAVHPAPPAPPTGRVAARLRALCAADAAVGGWPVARALAAHAVVLARKGGPGGTV